MGADSKRKQARRRKFGGQESEPLLDTGINLDLKDTSANEPPKKKSKQAPPPRSSPEDRFPAGKGAAGNVAVVDESTDWGKEENLAAQKARRFIVFIGPSTLEYSNILGQLSDGTMFTPGNLPNTATDESIRTHFAKINPKSIRHRKEKETGKSKGFAFLEFEGYDRMKTCLKLYHQSNFEDGTSPTRELNVELTSV